MFKAPVRLEEWIALNAAPVGVADDSTDDSTDSGEGGADEGGEESAFSASSTSDGAADDAPGISTLSMQVYPGQPPGPESPGDIPVITVIDPGDPGEVVLEYTYPFFVSAAELSALSALARNDGYIIGSGDSQALLEYYINTLNENLALTGAINGDYDNPASAGFLGGLKAEFSAEWVESGYYNLKLTISSDPSLLASVESETYSFNVSLTGDEFFYFPPVDAIDTNFTIMLDNQYTTPVDPPDPPDPPDPVDPGPPTAPIVDDPIDYILDPIGPVADLDPAAVLPGTTPITVDPPATVVSEATSFADAAYASDSLDWDFDWRWEEDGANPARPLSPEIEEFAQESFEGSDDLYLAISQTRRQLGRLEEAIAGLQDASVANILGLGDVEVETVGGALIQGNALLEALTRRMGVLSAMAKQFAETAPELRDGVMLEGIADGSANASRAGGEAEVMASGLDAMTVLVAEGEGGEALRGAFDGASEAAARKAAEAAGRQDGAEKELELFKARQGVTGANI